MNPLTKMMYDDERVWPELADLCGQLLGFDAFQGGHACRLRMDGRLVYLELHGTFDFDGWLDEHPDTVFTDTDEAELTDGNINFSFKLKLTDHSKVVDPTHLTDFRFDHPSGYWLRFTEFCGDHVCQVIDLNGANTRRIGEVDDDIPWVAKVIDDVDTLTRGTGPNDMLHLAASALETAMVFLLAEDPSRDVSNLDRALKELTDA